jgi:hypothetical protein
MTPNNSSCFVRAGAAQGHSMKAALLIKTDSDFCAHAHTCEGTAAQGARIGVILAKNVHDDEQNTRTKAWWWFVYRPTR